MTNWLRRKQTWAFLLLAGAMPLGTVADCGYTPGLGGSFYLDRGGRDYFYDDDVVIIDDWGYDEVIYEEEIFYEDEYYYEDDCDWFFDCWW